jgi:uncharacterized membrane protein
MSASVWIESVDRSSAADTALKLAARSWFVVAALGQWIFATYVISFYGGAALRGNLNTWNEAISHAHVPGQTMNNFVVGAHIFLAMIIIAGAPLQLIPQVRTWAPAFHRWNGRVFMLAVVATSVAGLYMVWTRGATRSMLQTIGISVDALLIIAFAVLSLRYALKRDIRTHRRWALRLFMVVNAGWFFRVGLMFWVFVNRGPAGFDPKTFTGWFLDSLSFADYLLPLLLLELYLRTRDRGGVPARFAMAGALLVATVATGIGVAIATVGMWLPRM